MVPVLAVGVGAEEELELEVVGLMVDVVSVVL